MKPSNTWGSAVALGAVRWIVLHSVAFALLVTVSLVGLGCSEGPNGQRCFAGGTRIDTPFGDVPIEDLRVGDTVWSFDAARRTRTPGTVIRRAVHHGAAVRPLTLSSGRTIRVTDEHPIFVPAEGRYIPASDLDPGVALLTLGEDTTARATVQAVGELERGVTVYDLEISGHHNFFAEGALVHNKSLPSPIMYSARINLDWNFRTLEIWFSGNMRCRDLSASGSGGRELSARLIELLDDEQRRLAYDTDSSEFGSVPLLEVCLPGRPCFERTVFLSGQGSHWAFMVQDDVALSPETLELIDEIIEVHARCLPFEPRTVYAYPDCFAPTDCSEGEVCEVYEFRPVCVEDSCMSDQKRCPTGYVCADLPDDECDPTSGEACPGECVCRDICPAEPCESDRDCGYGRFCKGTSSKQCAQFDCMGGTALNWKCFCTDVKGCYGFLGAPPEGSVCVDDPRTVCDMATDPSCTGVCTPVPCAQDGNARCEGRVIQVCSEGLWSATAFCEDGCEAGPEPRCVAEPPASQ